MRIFSDNNLPDIDEWLRGVFDRLRGGGRKDRARAAKKDPMAAFRGEGNGGGDDDDSVDRARRVFRAGGGGGDLPKLPLRLVSLAAGAVLVVGFVLSGFFTVDASERAVMFRLGSPIGVRGPGLQWHVPLFEDYRIVNLTQVRRVEVGYRDDPKNKLPRESLMLTDNLNIIDMQFVVQFVLKDAELYLFENRSPEAAVQQVAETAMRETVGKSDIDFVLYEGREEVAEDAKALMQRILDVYNTGIDIRQVAVQNVQPPDQVQGAFEDAIKARQDRDRKINEGEAYANNILPRARGQAARILEDARAFQRQAVVRAEGETFRFDLLAQEFTLAPKVTRRRLYLETMEEVMERANKVLIDPSDGGGGNLLYLPLDQLAGAAAAARAGRDEDKADGGGSSSSLSGDAEDLRARLRREIGDGARRIVGSAR